jgi:hypothetical protein
MLRAIWSFCLILMLLLWGGTAQAGVLANRIALFPRWESKPPVSVAQEDLIYPAWMEGTWNVTSTLIDLIAPLAPEVVTPGFESNRRYLNQPIQFQVRFIARSPTRRALLPITIQPSIVADRVFNGLNIGKTYLGDRAILAVKVDPNTPNRQVTLLTGDRLLVSVVTRRGTEMPTAEQFVATEVSQQVFRQKTQLYFNEVETTTAYSRLSSSPTRIQADQITAIYLSPQDANYFKTGDRPVALYRYQLELVPASSTANKTNPESVAWS